MTGQWDRRERIMDEGDYIVHHFERLRFRDSRWFAFAVGVWVGIGIALFWYLRYRVLP